MRPPTHPPSSLVALAGAIGWQPRCPLGLRSLVALGLAACTVLACPAPVQAQVEDMLESVSGQGRPLRQTMAWTQRPGLDLGLGVVLPQPAARGVAPTLAPGVVAAPGMPGADVPPSAVLALGRQLVPGVDMRLGLRVPLATPAAAQSLADTTRPGNPPELRLGMALVPSRAYDGLRRGLAMRVELSGATTLTLKPRGRRLTVQLSSQW